MDVDVEMVRYKSLFIVFFDDLFIIVIQNGHKACILEVINKLQAKEADPSPD